MPSLRWQQVNTWRLSQHYLLERAERQQMLKVVSAICGLHAQVMSAAELALWARVQHFQPRDVRDALRKKHTLVKTWAMRGTLHLVVADEFPMYAAALSNSVSTFYRRPSWLKYHGVTLDELEAIIEGVHETLSGEGMTREQLAVAIAERMGKPQLRELLGSGWGALLKPAAHPGYLCFGPNQGQNVTFVHPAKWIRNWHPVEPQPALQEILRRYLGTYGPATVDDFGRWLGIDPAKAKRLFKTLGEELTEVDVEGRKAWALTSSLKQLEKTKVSHSVRLLPQFDPYTVAMYRHCQYLLPEKDKARVYRSQGWISAVVLVNGRMEGVWEYEKKGAQTVVRVAMFAPPADKVKRGVLAEAKLLGEYLESDVRLAMSNAQGDAQYPVWCIACRVRQWR
jgi:hypothetical protein